MKFSKDFKNWLICFGIAIICSFGVNFILCYKVPSLGLALAFFESALFSVLAIPFVKKFY